jgi:hypothetical protein
MELMFRFELRKGHQELSGRRISAAEPAIYTGPPVIGTAVAALAREWR